MIKNIENMKLEVVVIRRDIIEINENMTREKVRNKYIHFLKKKSSFTKKIIITALIKSSEKVSELE